MLREKYADVALQGNALRMHRKVVLSDYPGMPNDACLWLAETRHAKQRAPH